MNFANELYQLHSINILKSLFHIIYITEKPVRQHVQRTTFGLFVEASLCSGCPACFISTSFYLSKVKHSTICNDAEIRV